jgi:acetyl-CoA C-acetyltransferase
MKEAVIVSAVRTPLGNFSGSLAGIGATDLGAIVIAGSHPDAPASRKSAVNEVIMGQVLPCGYGQNPAKQAAVKAGLPWEAEAITVNKVCGSSLKSVMLAAQAIQTGDAEVVVAGGMENMSMAPYYLEKARFGYRMGPGQLQDSMIHDGLWDIVNDFHMGVSNELCSERYQRQPGRPGPLCRRILSPGTGSHQQRSFRRRDRARLPAPAQRDALDLRQG